MEKCQSAPPSTWLQWPTQHFILAVNSCVPSPPYHWNMLLLLASRNLFYPIITVDLSGVCSLHILSDPHEQVTSHLTPHLHLHQVRKDIRKVWKYYTIICLHLPPNHQPNNDGLRTFVLKKSWDYHNITLWTASCWAFLSYAAANSQPSSKCEFTPWKSLAYMGHSCG